jgi:hypothetical protein
MSTTPTRPLPSEVRDRTSKLLPMLSSDHKGERVGAVAAIERVLRGANLDWHDLAGLITAPAQAAREPPRQQHEPDANDTIDAEELVDLITRLRDSGACFGSRSDEFLDGLLARAQRYDGVFLGTKQRVWLDDLARRAGVVL